MGDYINRMTVELEELQDRVTSLNNFIGNSKFNSLSITERSLLSLQQEYMVQYKEVLEVRLDSAKKATPRNPILFGHDLTDEVFGNE